MSRLGPLALLLVACSGPPDAEKPGPALPALAARQTRDLREEIVYELMVDRFADGAATPPDLPAQPVPNDLARFQGGDWRGLSARLPYIRDLGMTAIWISPIFENIPRYVDEDGYHGYWASDLTRLNPYFGQLEDLQALVREAHDLGLKVFVDVAPNHFGQVFTYDLNGDGQASADEMQPPFRAEPYPTPLDWVARPALFHGLAPATDDTTAPSSALTRTPLGDAAFHRRGRIESFADPTQVELGDFPKGLRDLDTEDDSIVQGLVDTYSEWIRLSDIDGFRLDAVPHAKPAFWAALCTGLRERLRALGRERFFLFGEVFRSEPAELASYTGPGSMDSTLDFSFWARVIGGYALGGLSAESAASALSGERSYYRAEPQPGGVGLDPWQARLAFADNHDTGRILGKLPDPYAVELAMTLVFTVDAIPVVYYGTEQGFDGVTQHAAREPMWWAGYGEHYPLFQRIRALAALRRSHAALTLGDLSLRFASAADGSSNTPDAGLLAFERSHETDRLLVVANAHATQTSSARFAVSFAPGTQLHNALAPGASAVSVSADQNVSLSLPARSAAVFVPN
jgi:glycosidase